MALSWRSQVVCGLRSREPCWGGGVRAEPRQKVKGREPGPERQDWDSNREEES